VGLCASIENLAINNKQIGGINKVIVLCKTEQSQGKFYITASSIWGDHVFSERVFLWRSKRFKTREEAIGYLTKEVRVAQKKFPGIIFFKTDKFVDGEIIEYDEFLDEKWIRSRHKWDWDPPFTMRDLP